MTNNNNLIPKENKAQIEEVREINTETPSLEEFMKNYEYDTNLNYDDLNGGDISEVRGYGPCSSCGNSSLKFELEIILKSSSHGEQRRMTLYCVDDAHREASRIIRKVEDWTDHWVTYADTGKRVWSAFSQKERSDVVNKINDAIDEHINGKNIKRVVENEVDDSNNDDDCCNSIM